MVPVTDPFLPDESVAGCVTGVEIVFLLAAEGFLPPPVMHAHVDAALPLATYWTFTFAPSPASLKLMARLPAVPENAAEALVKCALIASAADATTNVAAAMFNPTLFRMFAS